MFKFSKVRNALVQPFYLVSFIIFGIDFIILNCRYLLISISAFFIFIIGCDRKANLEKLSENSDSLQILFDLANNDKVPYSKRHEHAEKVLSIISKADNDSITRVNYFKVANRFFNMNALEDYKIVVELIIPRAHEAKDTLCLAKAYEYLGDYFGKKFQSEKAFSAYLEAEKLYISKEKYSNIAKVVLNKAIIQLNEKDFVGSEKSAFKALTILKKANDAELMYQSYNVLGIIYDELGEYNKSIEYYEKALKIAKSGNVSLGIQAKATTLNNIGALNQKKQKYKKALEYFHLSLKEKNLCSDNLLLYAALKYNIGYSEFKMKNYTHLPRLYYESLHLADSLKFTPSIIACKLNLSEYYLEMKDTMKAYNFASQAYSLAKANNNSKDILNSLKQLSNVNPIKKAFYSDEYIKINDSLQLAERQTRNKLARIEYETDQLATEKANLVEQRRTLIYIALGIILIGAFVFLIRSQAAKNRELRLLREQQAANEEIYRLMISQQQQRDEGRQLEKKRIARELHDGVMGQLTAIRMNLFPLGRKQDPETIRECLPHIDKIRDIEQEIRSIAYDLDSP